MQNFKMKKILAEVLAASMILTSFSVPAMAAEAEDLVEDTAIVEEAVEAAEEDAVGAAVTNKGLTYDLGAWDDGTKTSVWSFDKDATDAAEHVFTADGEGGLFYFGDTAKKVKADASNSIKISDGYVLSLLADDDTETFDLYVTMRSGSNDRSLVVGTTTITDTKKLADDGETKIVDGKDAKELVTHSGKKYVDILAKGNGDGKGDAKITAIKLVEHKTVSQGPVSEEKVNVTFISGDASQTFEVVSGNKISTGVSENGIIALQPAEAAGQVFAGWKSSADDKVYSSAEVAKLPVNADTTFTAVVSASVKVTFTWTHSDTTTKEESDDKEVITIAKGGNLLGYIPTATVRYGYRFKGWSDGTHVMSQAQLAEMSIQSDAAFTGVYEAIPAGNETAVKPVTEKMVYNVNNFIGLDESKIDWTKSSNFNPTDRRYLLNDNLAFVANYAANGNATSVLTNVKKNAEGLSGLGVYGDNMTDADQAIVDKFEYFLNLKCRITGDVDWKNVSTGVMSPYTDGYYEFETSEPSEVVVYWAAAGTSKAYELVLCDPTKTPAVDGEAFFVDYDYVDGAQSGAAVAKTVFNVDKAQKYWISTANHDQANGAKIYRIEVTPKSAQGSDDPTPAPGGEDGNDDDNNTSVSEDSVTSTGDPALTPATAAEVSANYAKLVAGDASVGYKAAVGDTGVLKYVFKKGKVKAISVSTNSVSACKVTLNAKTKVILPADYANTVGTISGNAGVKPVKVNKKGYASLKASKSAAKYDVVFKNAKGETITITVVNLGFDKGLKKLMVSPSQNLIVRPTLMTGKTTNIKQGAGFLNGVWTVDKTVISKPGQTVAGKNGAKVTLNANGTVTVTNVAGKGSVKLTYTLNGKKYTTALKVQKKASGAESTYTAAGLLK